MSKVFKCFSIFIHIDIYFQNLLHLSKKQKRVKTKRKNKQKTKKELLLSHSMRLFYGVVPPDNIIKSISLIINQLATSNREINNTNHSDNKYNNRAEQSPEHSIINDSIIKPVKTQNLHFTILFLGEFEKHKAIKALNSLSVKAFKTKLSSIGFFPSSKYIRIIWIGAKPEQPFITINNQLTTALEIKADKKFKPHLTIARVKKLSQTTKQRLLKFKERADNMISSLPSFVVDRVVLFNSVLSAKGPDYNIVSEKWLG